MSRQLHEVLAVEPSLRSAADSVVNETVKTLSNKREHFIELNKSFKVVNPEYENDPGFPSEHSPMVTTVPKKLRHLVEILSKAIDAGFQIDKTNMQATADLEFDGKTIKDVPATFLMRLDKKLSDLRRVVSAIPTLDPKYDWAKDEATGTYRSEDEQTHRTTKKPDFKIVSEATDKHPAQIEQITIDRFHGTWTKKRWSGELSVSDKYEINRRLDEIQNAVKRALAAANRIEHSTDKIAGDVLGYLFDGFTQEE